MDISKLVINSDKKVSDALRVIDRNGLGICFIVEIDRVVGILTDGDIRRSIIRGIEIDELVKNIMNEKFTSLMEDTSIEEIQSCFRNKKIKCIPILNSNGQLKDVATPESHHQIPLIQTDFSGNELKYVTNCILTGWISSQGDYVRQFERDFANFIGSGTPVAVANGTVALHLALVSLGIGPEDEVIVPDLTFAAPINSILYCGATPVFIDIRRDSLCIDENLLIKSITNKTKAIIVVHLYGNSANIEIIQQVAQNYGLFLIEDCAEAIGTRSRLRHVGTFGDAATFSFFGNKTITTGEGGMILFRDEAVARQAIKLRDHGMSSERRYWHDEIGFNYRMTNLQAAIGVAQLEKASVFVSRKIEIGRLYTSIFNSLNEVQTPKAAAEITHSNWLYVLTLLVMQDGVRDQLIIFLKNLGIETRRVFYPAHVMPPYKKFNTKGLKFPMAIEASERGICLPTSIKMSDEDVYFVAERIQQFLKS